MSVESFCSSYASLWRGFALCVPFRFFATQPYPRLRAYFLAHEERIKTRHIARKNLKSWYRTIDKISEPLTHQPKLLIPDIKGVPSEKSTRLVALLELKSQVGSFGNNINNRCEEAIGTAVDFWTAFREGAFGTSPKPFVGYLMLLQDCPAVYAPVRVEEHHFKVFADFRGSFYARRYELLCQRLVQEGLYDASTLLLSSETDGPQGVYTELQSGGGLQEWVARLAGHVALVAATL